MSETALRSNSDNFEAKVYNGSTGLLVICVPGLLWDISES